MGLISDTFAPRLMADSEAQIAARPGAWTPGRGYLRSTVAGEDVHPDKAMTLPAWYACINNISQDIGRLPLVVLERLDPRGNKVRRDHPLHAMFNREANPEMTAISGRTTSMHHALGWGRGPSEIQRDGAGRPVALWPIHPSRVRLKRIDGDLWYEVHADDLAAARDMKTRVVMIPARDMLDIHGLGSNGLQGYSLVQLAAETFGVGLAAELFAASFFGNGTHVGGVIETVHTLSDTETENLRHAWTELHAGARNANSPAILQQGYSWKPTAIPPRDAQLFETRTFTILEFARLVRMPPHMIQEMSRATFSNIESQGIEYATYTLGFWFTAIEQELERKLFSEAEKRTLTIRHRAQALMRGDQAARANYYRTMFNLGAKSPNDIRELEDDNPIPGEAGDRYYIQRNMSTLDAVADPTDPAPVPPQFGGPPPQPDDSDEGGDAAEPGDAEAREARLRNLADANRPNFEEAAARATRRETHGVKQGERECKGDPVAFAKWTNRFYSSHRRFIVDAFSAPCAALAAMAENCGYDASGIGTALDRWLDEWHRESLSCVHALFAAGDGVAETLASTEPERARSMCDHVLDLTVDAVLETDR